MTCSQLEVTSDCVCAQPQREHLVQEFEALDHGTFEFHPHTLIGGEYPHNAFVYNTYHKE